MPPRQKLSWRRNWRTPALDLLIELDSFDEFYWNIAVWTAATAVISAAVATAVTMAILSQLVWPMQKRLQQTGDDSHLIEQIAYLTLWRMRKGVSWLHNWSCCQYSKIEWTNWWAAYFVVADSLGNS